ncbi:MAG: sialate O-acetylesterase [Opitutaceae bacterium]|jgi:sialate O-acetylesterase|nr:sialate O-acetylesterase [Opitutaceae bacterium]
MKNIIHGKWRKPGHWGFTCMCFCLALNAGARVAPASLFTDHMVLQHGKPIYVWGTAAPGERVQVSLGALASGGASADGEGNWLVELPAQPVAASPLTLGIRGENEVRVEDVLIGEVWLGSGQSNMGVSAGGTTDWDSVQKEIAAGDFSRVRVFQMAWTASDAPRRDLGGARWRVSDNNSLRNFSAVMVYFARALQRARPGVPVGIIQSAVGATNAHAWLPNDAFENGKGAAYIRRWYRGQLDKLPVENKLYAEKLERHLEAVEKAKQEKRQPPRAPEPPMGPESKRRPACLYNGMIAPLQPYGIRGVAWYQGENNASLQWAGDYAALMADLINGWRADWARAARRDKPDMLPFLIVQLPNFKNGNVWPLLREQQERIAQSVPETGLVCIIDSGDPGDIHPRNKTPVGERLALAARALVYGEGGLVWSGPVFHDAACGDGRAVVSFRHTGGGLTTADGEPPRGFEIAGDDRKFFPAAAKLSGRSVVLESPHVPRPVAVRYAWENNPENLNLYNKENLPALPFRTDDWPWPAGGKSK